MFYLMEVEHGWKSFYLNYKNRTMEIRAIIVEDELPAQETLMLYLEKYCPEVKVLATATDMNKALEAIRHNAADVVFLDVELPYGNAFDLLEKVGDIQFQTIFITAYEQYAMDALNHDAVHYILKPIEIDELIKAVDKVKQQLLNKQKQAKSELKHVNNFRRLQDKKFVFPHLRGFDLVEIHKIVYCKADNNYTEFTFTEGKKVLISKTLGKVEEQLKTYGFFRVHKKYLVNLNHIKSYQRGKAGSLIMSDDSEINITTSKKDLLNELLG
jgi:two-component system LytT family response regulator